MLKKIEGPRLEKRKIDIAFSENPGTARGVWSWGFLVLSNLNAEPSEQLKENLLVIDFEYFIKQDEMNFMQELIQQMGADMASALAEMQGP